MTRKQKRTTESKRFRWRVVIIVLLLILLLLPLFHLVDDEQESVVLIPDQAPEDMEPGAQAIPNDTDEKPENTSGGSVRLSYSDKVTIDLSEKQAQLYFGNPGRSNQDMLLRIVIADEVIVQSGLLPAGYQVETLDLLPDAASKLQRGTYSGKFAVYYYDQQTDELATINTEIPITVVVEK